MYENSMKNEKKKYKMRNIIVNGIIFFHSWGTWYNFWLNKINAKKIKICAIKEEMAAPTKLKYLTNIRFKKIFTKLPSKFIDNIILVFAMIDIPGKNIYNWDKITEGIKKIITFWDSRNWELIKYFKPKGNIKINTRQHIKIKNKNVLNNKAIWFGVFLSL